jgi:predicted nuclease of predicted toxin-antitoxin system
MQFVADESVTMDIVLALRKQGHVVLAICEAYPSVSDEEVLSIALARGEVLLSEDKDFGELVFNKQLPHSGVVLFRLDGMRVEEKVARVVMVIGSKGSKLQHAFTVIDGQKVRSRSSASRP